MATFVPLSSTKTSVAGSRWAVSAHHAARSSSSRSRACRTFFDRDPEAVDDPRHGGHADGHPLLRSPAGAMLSQGGVGGGSDLGPQGRRVRGTDARGAAGTRSRRHGTRGALAPPPADDRAGTDAEEPGGLGHGKPAVDRSQQPLAEVGRVLLHALPSHTSNSSATRSSLKVGSSEPGSWRRTWRSSPAEAIHGPPGWKATTSAPL